MSKNDPATFQKIADGYMADGFFLKALALYKHILKLAPEMLDVALRVAELHQQLGLTPEALTSFHVVARLHEKAGDTRRLMETLEKMVELDSGNVPLRLRLMGCYVREGLADKAARELEKVAEHLSPEGSMKH